MLSRPLGSRTTYARSMTSATPLTNGAAAGESPIALMTRAGQAKMSTTQTYLHLAGVVFPDEAKRLEQRFGAVLQDSSSREALPPGVAELVQSGEVGTEPGTDPREPERI